MADGMEILESRTAKAVQGRDLGELLDNVVALFHELNHERESLQKKVQTLERQNEVLSHDLMMATYRLREKP